MILHEKGRAAATANSDHPAKENLHKQDSTTSTQRMQERFSSNNAKVLRWINAQRQLYTALKSIASDLRADGISTKETCKSIGYLSAKGYISVSKNGQAVKITAQGIRLLAGIIEDSEVSV
ncbi:hypothetical protein D3Z39_12290 [Anaerotruncus colihominis]|uniref:Uncharacterized protein n=1 Tax=Anaerotruncus colihominis TaxID=169435 RepID=A0A845RJ90_9FIRM|nr:hypothetical protein [Anaerotruncus colihominis]NBI79633.1 hypothetical protein [Anaerotruncus colihominis]